MELQGRKVAILIEEMFNTYEFWYPYYRLKEAGAEVVVIGTGTAEVYHGKPGTEATPDFSVDHVSADDFDGVVIPGGYAPDLMRRSPQMVQLVKDIFHAGFTLPLLRNVGAPKTTVEALARIPMAMKNALKSDNHRLRK